MGIKTGVTQRLRKVNEIGGRKAYERTKVESVSGKL